jgi:lipopolysaccharide transport system ATP-binding protein
MNSIIKIENISKMYRLGLVGSSTIQDDIKRKWYHIRGKEDPFLKIGEENKRDTLGSDYVWALKDINLELEQGDVLGIIGKNGAGKSTLLKLLSKVTRPTTGKILTNGRIASLLEVGTGFHPELTGRENIFLNGAILGMKKNEIKSKFDEIVSFSGCERYIDTPVKRYSSGMYVRLAFAVAAFLEPDILVVDEVLAVGDAEFQKKAIGKMQDVSNKDGRTVIFVSHNMVSIKSLCNKGVLLENGKVKFVGNTNETINNYFSSASKTKQKGVILNNFKRYNTGEIKIQKIQILNSNSEQIDDILFKNRIRIKIKLECFKTVNKTLLDIKIVSNDGIIITDSISSFQNQEFLNIDIGTHEFLVEIENYLQPGSYSLTVGAHYDNGISIDVLENIYDFNVLKISNSNDSDYKYGWVNGWINLDSKWKKINDF